MKRKLYYSNNSKRNSKNTEIKPLNASEIIDTMKLIIMY